MTGIWKLFYKLQDDGSADFAEILDRDGDLTLCTGGVFTMGESQQLESVASAESKLTSQGFELMHDWTFDRANQDFGIFEKIIGKSIQSDKRFDQCNALAIITDSSLMTVSFALACFEDLEATSNDVLWIVDEWGQWSVGWDLDPAYRWLLAYGFNDSLEHEDRAVFQDQVKNCFLRVLRSCRDSKEILLIYIGGDDLGHHWSQGVMSEALTKRMLSWL